MNVLGTSNSFFYDMANLTGKSKAHKTEHNIQPELPQNNTEQVTISAQGKALSDQTPEGLLRFALPSWFTDYIPSVNVLNNANTHQTGYTAWADSYRNTYNNEMQEFGKIFNEAFESAKAEHGISTQNDMYEKVIKNQDFSEMLRKSVDEKILSVPGAVELMNILGLGKSLHS